MNMTEVSVVVVNWNTQDILRDCLKSIYEQAGEIDLEVIVIDNASTDGSVEMVKKDFPQVTLIENSQNRGFAAANNQGIDISKGRYVLLLNSDTVVLDNAIAKTVAFADSHPKAAIVGCRVLNPDQTLQPTCFMFPSILNMLLSSTYLYKIFPKSKFFGREQMTWWDRSDVREVDVVTGCFMLIRRKAIQQVGTMDEQFFMYGEETDWCYRWPAGKLCSLRYVKLYILADKAAGKNVRR
jgi:GT2 family glycosyltransferase